MFFTFEFKEFSKYLLQLRINLGLSRPDVSKMTGLNEDTIRRIESNSSIPKFETLILLSRAYKTDLLLDLHSLTKDPELVYIYNTIDIVLTQHDENQIKFLINKFIKYTESSSNSPCFDVVENSQVIGLLNELLADIKNVNKDKKEYRKSINKCYDLLRKNNIKLTEKNYKDFKYTYIEKRILYFIACIFFELDKYEESLDILLFLYNQVDLFKAVNIPEHRINISIIYMISYNYHMQDLHEKALYYTEKGIDYCLYSTMSFNLSALYFRKGVSEYNLGNLEESKSDLKKSLNLVEISENQKLFEIYQELVKKYFKEL